jgi:hypothetical protein
MEMKCISNIGEKNSILAKVTQVSDVAHGPLVDFVDYRNKNTKNLKNNCRSNLTAS